MRSKILFVLVSIVLCNVPSSLWKKQSFIGPVCLAVSVPVWGCGRPEMAAVQKKAVQAVHTVKKQALSFFLRRASYFPDAGPAGGRFFRVKTGETGKGENLLKFFRLRG
ncbi:hypothetical protein [Pontiella sp.]|uniref:hypothetical protein n=1 Tax=Pontiella sp. TaxID=2837462 RepID=UPI003569A79E